MPQFLVFDIGGQSVRLAVLDEFSNILWCQKQSIKTIYPNNVSVEHDPDEVINSCHSLLDSVEHLQYEIKSVALATQRSSIICWDKVDGKPIGNIISWQDTRAEGLLSEIIEQSSRKESLSFQSIQEDIREITGLYPSAHYGASKMRFCLNALKKDNTHTSIHNTRLLITPLASWILVQLQLPKTDTSNVPQVIIDQGQAQRTLLWNIEKCDWDVKMLKRFNIAPEILPEVSDNLIRPVALASSMSVNCELLIGDQAAAIFAHGVPNANTCYINAGTGAFMLLPYRVPAKLAIPKSLLNSVVYSDSNIQINAVEATINGAASALAWCDRETGVESQSRPSYLYSGVAADSCFLNGVSGLAAPWWRADFKSRFINAESTQEKYQAVYESILFLIKNNFDLMMSAGFKVKRVLLSGGLSKVPDYAQALASLLRRPVYCDLDHEATLKGAGFILANMNSNSKIDVVNNFASNPDFGKYKLQMFEPEDITNANPTGLYTRYQFWLQQMSLALTL